MNASKLDLVAYGILVVKAAAEMREGELVAAQLGGTRAILYRVYRNAFETLKSNVAELIDAPWEALMESEMNLRAVAHMLLLSEKLLDALVVHALCDDIMN